MSGNKKGFKFGRPLSPEEIPQSRRRLPQYDECLREFLKSGHKYWEVNLNALPSKKPRVVLSSLKWRIQNKPEFKGIRVFMYKNKVYLEKLPMNRRDQDSHFWLTREKKALDFKVSVDE